MIPSGTEAISRRQRALLVRSTELRSRLLVQATELRPPLLLAERVRSGWQWLRRHPEWPLGFAVALVVLRPRRALRWASRLWWAWREGRRLWRQLRLDTLA